MALNQSVGIESIAFENSGITTSSIINQSIIGEVTQSVNGGAGDQSMDAATYSVGATAIGIMEELPIPDLNDRSSPVVRSEGAIDPRKLLVMPPGLAIQIGAMDKDAAGKLDDPRDDWSLMSTSKWKANLAQGEGWWRLALGVLLPPTLFPITRRTGDIVRMGGGAIRQTSTVED